MITRQEYMADSKALHDEYYLQFATAATMVQVSDSIGIDELLKSTDHHLNDVKIPFNNMSRGGTWWWDTVSINVELARKLGDNNSFSTRTNVSKAVARLMLAVHKDNN